MKYLIFLLSLILPATLLAQTQWVDATGDTIRVISKTGIATAGAPGVIGIKDSIVQFTVKVPVMGTVQIPYSYKYDTVIVIKKQQPPLPVVVDPPPATGSGQTFTFSIQQVDWSKVSRPFAGLETWSGQWIAPQSFPAIDGYYRFSWSMLESSQGTYTFDAFKKQIEAVIKRGGKFAYRIMTHYPDAVPPHRLNYDGGYAVYPEYLHKLMQAETVKDWKASNGAWVPNWNSKAYLTRWEALNVALNAYINANGWGQYINYIDVSGYGAFNEWHSYTIVDQMNQYPAGTRATTATLLELVNIHLRAYPNFPAVALVACFDRNYFNNTMNPPELAYHVLTARNNWGLIGWRRDNWGATDQYLRAYTDQNTVTVKGMRLDTAIMNRWKYAPVVGEPCCSADYADLLNQVNRYHTVSIGNGNVPSGNATINKNLTAAGAAAGARVTITGGSFKDGVITVNWSNTGLTPVYEDFETWFELRQSGVVKWSGKSASTITMRLPGTWSTTDAFTGFPTGEYELHVVVKNGQRSYPLGITSSKLATIKL